MSPARMNRVLREAPSIIYALLASLLSIACVLTYLQGMGVTGPLDVTGGIGARFSDGFDDVLATISTWLVARGDIVTVVGAVALVVGIVFFNKERRSNLDILPAWFGTPTALIGLAVLWEVHPGLTAWLSLGLFVLFSLAFSMENLFSPRICNDGSDGISFLGRALINLIMVGGFVVLGPLAVLVELWPRRADTGQQASV